MYVDPEVKVLRQTTNPDKGLDIVEDKPAPRDVSTCRRLFYTDTYQCHHVYLTGDAGSGKTMFCKHLVDLWCSSDRPQSSCSGAEPQLSSSQQDLSSKQTLASRMKEDDRHILSQFDLLFYITLRDLSELYHIEDMIDSEVIDSQMFQQSKATRHLKTSDLLERAHCLVVIDGLDEWTRLKDTKPLKFVNPEIPGRDYMKEKTVYLTTTRPWKLDVMNLGDREIDKHVKLAEFNTDMAKQHSLHVIKLLKPPGQVEEIQAAVWTELQEKGLGHLHNLPVILTQLVCRYCKKRQLSGSRVRLYSDMVEMLLNRAASKKPAKTRTFTRHCKLGAPSSLLHRADQAKP